MRPSDGQELTRCFKIIFVDTDSDLTRNAGKEMVDLYSTNLESDVFAYSYRGMTHGK